ncbi:MAG TPA: hypothetical protein V6D05_00225 [Stenomitos sp.]
MRSERWTTATVLTLCVVAALVGANLAKNRAERVGGPNPWVMPK